MLLSEDPNKLEVFLDRLSGSVDLFGLRFLL